MACPTCMHCGKDLEDWQANVMIEDGKYSTGDIDELQYLCKPCTRTWSGARNYHNMWELSWVKNNYFYLLGTIINDITDANSRRNWSKDALEDFWQLGTMIYGDYADPISSVL